MDPTREQLEQLAKALPSLDLTPGDSTNVPGLQAYLDFYQIDFSAILSGVQHRCGVLQLLDFRVAVHCWSPPQPRGSLLVVHGYYDHAGIYGNAIRFGLEQGYSVLIFDLPGHGLSSGEPASIESFDQYGDTLAGLLAAVGDKLPGPIHALGQSTGSAALLNYLWRHADSTLGQVALFSPLVLPYGWHFSGRWMHLLLRSLVPSIRRKFRNSTHNPQFNEFIAQRDPLQCRSLPTPWVTAMKQWDKDTRQYPPLDRPVLIVQGTADTTVDRHYNLQRLRNKLPKADIRLIEGARHQLVNETANYRDPAFEQVRQWLDGKSGPKGTAE